MKIAKSKIEENIAEYILYMYQIEDTLRAFELNIDRIMNHVVKPLINDENDLILYRKWYTDLINKMKEQKIEQKGHFIELNELIVEISYLHNTLLTIANDQKYKNIVENSNPFVEEFKNKSNLADRNTIEVLLHAMYMKLLLKLSKKSISNESEEAFDAMRIQLAYLVAAYHKMKKGNLDFLNN